MFYKQVNIKTHELEHEPIENCILSDRFSFSISWKK